MNPDLVPDLFCLRCSGSDLCLETYLLQDKQVREGRVLCRSCQAWYRIENCILDLMPPDLGGGERRREFARKYDLPYAAEDSPASRPKLAQMHFFTAGVRDYEQNVTYSPYFAALDALWFEGWLDEHLEAGLRVLDVGCGTGRQILPMARRGLKVVGVDLSEEMLGLAQSKLSAEGLVPLVNLIRADAETMPLREQIFDACVMVGTLHHLPQPEAGVLEAAQKIRPGGLFYSYDPHQSPVRFLFDWAMKFCRLYEEEASEAPLFTEHRLQTILHEAGIESKTRLTTYLLPHVFYLFRHQTNIRLLRLTDAVFTKVPGLRNLGGMVIAEGIRTAPSGGRHGQHPVDWHHGTISGPGG